jgi:hypothetical protein
MATKTASPIVYLMEELGDARLRCDQLVRYIEDAAKLVEKSPHKDGIFEVAGHLIHGVPQTALKLQRALQAVALAAGQIDQEELKRTLRPEKVKELERVLEDVRIRQVQRRGEPFEGLSRKQAAGELRTLADVLRLTGSFPHHGVARVIAALEVDSKTANVPDVAEGLERLAEALEGPVEDEAPSRVLLASTLRRMLGDACAEDFRGEGQIMATADWKTAKDDDKASGYAEGEKADPTKKMSPEDAKKWKENTQKHKDKFKAKDAGLHMIGHSTIKIRRSDDGGFLIEQGADELVVADIRQVVHEVEQRVKRDPKVIVMTDKYSLGPDQPADPYSERPYAIKDRRGTNVATGYSALGLWESFGPLMVWGKTIRSKEASWRGDFGGQEHIDSLAEEATAILGKLRRSDGRQRDSQHRELRSLVEEIGQAIAYGGRTAKDDDKSSKFKKDQPADPTKNMSPEEAKEWKANTEKHRDKFKKDAKFKKGEPADPTQNMSDEQKAEWKTQNEAHRDKFKSAKDDDKSSKFKKDQPADPTKDMSPEDAKKWKAENEKNRDKFKKDAAAGDVDWRYVDNAAHGLTTYAAALKRSAAQQDSQQAAMNIYAVVKETAVAAGELGMTKTMDLLASAGAGARSEMRKVALGLDPAYTQELTKDNIVAYLKRKRAATGHELSMVFDGDLSQQEQFLRRMVDEGVLQKAGAKYKLAKTAGAQAYIHVVKGADNRYEVLWSNNSMAPYGRGISGGRNKSMKKGLSRSQAMKLAEKLAVEHQAEILGFEEKPYDRPFMAPEYVPMRLGRSASAWKVASGSWLGSFMTYEEALSRIQAEVVGGAGQKLEQYVEMLGKRLRDDLAGSWTWGIPRQNGGWWECRVWNQGSGSIENTEGEDLDPNILIRAQFGGSDVKVECVVGNRDTILKKSWPANKASQSNIGMACGEAWEKKIKGFVDYGD